MFEIAATWNSGTDIDDSTRRQGSPTTDYEGTSSDCGDVFYNNANGTFNQSVVLKHAGVLRINKAAFK